MKRLLALILAMIMVFALFSGCNKSEENTTAASGDSQSSSGTPSGKMRTDIIICDGFDIVTFDPPEITDVYSGMTAQLIYDRLVRLDENAEVIPMLAESWEMPSDTEYVFKLREGVKFHNGDEMKASDVVFSLLRARDNPKSYTAFEMVENVEAIDDYTVKLTTKEPFAPMLLKLCGSNAGILSEKVVTEVESKGEAYGANPIGTGCMTMTTYKPNDHVLMTRFDDYWGGLVRATTITRRVIPEESSRTIALENGEVDYIDSLPSVDVERVRSNPDLKAVDMLSSSVAYIGLNVEREPFNNKDIRKALHYAINKQNIVDVQFEGLGIASTSIFPSIMYCFDKDLDMYPMDVEKAKEHMVLGGYPDGFSMKIIVSSELRSRICQLIQQDYKAINVELDIEMAEFGTVLDLTSRGEFDAFLLGWSNATDPDSTVMSNFHSSKIGGGGNRVRLNNPEIDALIDKARSTLDEDKRTEMYMQLQTMIMDECAWIPLVQQTYVAGMLKGVDGVEMYEAGGRYYRNMVVYED